MRRDSPGRASEHRAERGIGLAQPLDCPYDLGGLVAARAREPNEVSRARREFGLARGGRYDDAAPAAEIDEALVAERTERREHGVSIDAENGRQIGGRRQALALACFAVDDRAAQRSGGLVGDALRGARVTVDRPHGASDTSFMFGLSASAPASPAADPPGRLQALFDEAWQRARRRRLGTLGAVGLLVVALAAVLASRGTEPRDRARPASPRPSVLALPKPPGIGVACPAAPNSIACDRVGIAVWMSTTPALPAHLVATIGGRSVELRDLTDAAYCASRRPCSHFYTGYLHHAGLLDGALKVQPDQGRYRWYGRHPVTATMRITAITANGARAITTRHVELAPGWG